MRSFTFTGRMIAGGLLALSGGALGAGCGSSSSGPDYTSLETFCQALAQADCSAPVVTACYGSSSATLGDDIQSCVAARSTPERCNPAMLPYHAAYAQPCLDAHKAAYANGQLDAASLQMVQQACLPVFNKGGEKGATCTSDSDCDASSSLVCVVHQSGGSCQIPASAGAGEPCANPAAQCLQGYYCETGSHCVADPDQGGACGAGIPCADGLRCDTASACAPELKDGSACTSAGDCVGGFCILTGTGGVCAASYTFAVGSATCTDFM